MQTRRRLLDAGLTTLLALAICLTYRRVFGAGFFHDDWTYLARAAGFLPEPPIPARPLTFEFYWRMMGMLWGTHPIPYTISRFALHLGTGVLLAGVVRRIGGSYWVSWIAATFYLLSPLNFEALYWASAITDLSANFGLLLAFYGLTFRNRRGAVVFLVGGLINLLSKETGWWLPLVGVVIWRRGAHRDYYVFSGIMAIIAAASLTATAFYLKHDYNWTFREVPWNLLRAGSWLISRPSDLIQVWSVGSRAQLLGAGFWLSWITWSWFQWRRHNRLPALCLVGSMLTLATVAGLTDHMVPRYLLPVQACLAATISIAIPTGARRNAYTFIAILAMASTYTSWSVDQFVDRTYPTGRPEHMLVAKESLARTAWRYLRECGVNSTTGAAFLRRPDDDVGARDFILDVIGRTWGPQVVFGFKRPVIITDSVSDIPLEMPVFQFNRWSLEYVGVLRMSDSE